MKTVTAFLIKFFNVCLFIGEKISIVRLSPDEKIVHFLYRYNKRQAMIYDGFNHYRMINHYHDGPAVLKYIRIHRPGICYHYYEILT